MKKLLSKVIIVSVSAILILPALTHAQVFTPYTIEEAQTVSKLTITPKYPSIGESVNVELSSFAIDLDNSFVSFYKNDSLLKEGFGIRKVNYGPVRDSVAIKVTIKTPDGVLVEKTKTLIPGSVNIIWEALNYTPPFYKGKSLYTKESDLKVTAIPTMKDSSGNIVSSQDIIYTWKINNQIQTSLSGLGRETVIIEEIFLGSKLKIEVLAESRNREVFAVQTETIETVDPGLYFYENDPLYGINWSQVMSNTVVEDEISIFSSPLYFSSQDISELFYTWKANGITLGESSNTVTIRNESDSSGIVRINLAVENINSFFERAQSSLALQFK